MPSIQTQPIGDEGLVCIECGERHPFEMPPEVLSAALEGKLVIFAGAGVSTESRLVLHDTFADTCRAALGDIRHRLGAWQPPDPIGVEVVGWSDANTSREYVMRRLRSRPPAVASQRQALQRCVP